MQEQELNQNYFEMQMATQRISQLEEQLKLIEGKIQGLKENVEHILSIKQEQSLEVLVPIVEGMFAKAKVEDTSEVCVNAGAGVVVKKTVEQAAGMLREKELEAQNYKKQLVAEIEKSSTELREFEKKFETSLAKENV